MDNQLVRNTIYQFFVDQARPPSVAEAAAALGRPEDEVREAYLELGRKHAVFLDPGASEPQVRMAFPFSAVPTPFRVHVGQRSYWANCAWDMLGIPAALKMDASIEAECADCGEKTSLQVRDGRVTPDGWIAHFLLPFRQWYEDLVLT